MAVQKKAKDSWCWMYKGEDETYNVFPSYKAALKGAMENTKNNMYDENSRTVEFYQKVKEVKFEVTVVEVPAVTQKRTLTVKE